MSDSQIVNWWRVRRGRPARNMSNAEMDRRLDRSGKERRATEAELSELVRLTEEFDLPMPFDPTAVVDGFIVHPQSR